MEITHVQLGMELVTKSVLQLLSPYIVSNMFKSRSFVVNVRQIPALICPFAMISLWIRRGTFGVQTKMV